MYHKVSRAVLVANKRMATYEGHVAHLHKCSLTKSTQSLSHVYKLYKLPKDHLKVVYILAHYYKIISCCICWYHYKFTLEILQIPKTCFFLLLICSLQSTSIRLTINGFINPFIHIYFLLLCPFTLISCHRLPTNLHIPFPVR